MLRVIAAAQSPGVAFIPSARWVVNYVTFLAFNPAELFGFAASKPQFFATAILFKAPLAVRNVM